MHMPNGKRTRLPRSEACRARHWLDFAASHALLGSLIRSAYHPTLLKGKATLTGWESLGPGLITATPATANTRDGSWKEQVLLQLGFCLHHQKQGSELEHPDHFLKYTPYPGTASLLSTVHRSPAPKGYFG